MMKDIKLVTQEKYNDRSKFKNINGEFYQVLYKYENGLVEEGQYVATFAFTLEKDLVEPDTMQYPLEDLLDKYYAHVSDFMQYEEGNEVLILELCTQDWLNEMTELIKIAGKRVFNKVVDRDGSSVLELVIE